MRRWMVLVLVMLGVSACSQKKLVVRNCEKAGNAEVFVCDPI